MQAITNLVKKVFTTIFVMIVGLTVLGFVVGGDEGGSKTVAATLEMSAGEKAAKIAALEEEAKAVPATEYDQNLKLYRKLQALDLDSQRYQEKVAHYSEKKDEARRMKSSPELYVKIVDFSWTKEAFGIIMEATFTIKNELPVEVKDIKVKCTHSAPSGTVVDTNRRTIYEVIGARKTRTFHKFDMGFIHSQANSSSCRVVEVTRIG
jgi:hypothetical protein